VDGFGFADIGLGRECATALVLDPVDNFLGRPTLR
jgi:hypothetical protein